MALENHRETARYCERSRLRLHSPVGIGILVAVITIASLYATLLFQMDPRALLYARPAVLDGAWWRLFSANFVHGGIGHWFLNITALILIAAIFPARIAVRGLLVVLPLCALAVTGGLLLFSPEIQWYVGLSGALHGVFAFGALHEALRGSWTWRGVFLLLCLKLLYEQGIGPLPGSVELAGLAVVVDAHLYGAIPGALAAVAAQIPGPAVDDE